MKRLLLLFAALVLAMVLASCGSQGQNAGNSPDSGSNSAQTLPQDAPAHQALMADVKEMMDAAEKQGDMGQTFTEEYLLGMAQAEISSLRQCVDTVLWLKGEGADLQEVLGDAPYKDWDAIVGAGPGSSAPFYFEGLLYTFQGKDDEAKECYDHASLNPNDKERDLYYLRNLSVEELYAVKKEAAALEQEVYSIYTPRTRLIAERTGAECSPEYHLLLAQSCEDSPSDALQCAVNALLTNPLSPLLYASAAFYAIEASEPAQAVSFTNEGLFIFPEDSTLNYMAALICVLSGDSEQARSFLKTAEANADDALSEDINKLYEQIGGR